MSMKQDAVVVGLYGISKEESLKSRKKVGAGSREYEGCPRPLESATRVRQQIKLSIVQNLAHSLLDLLQVIGRNFAGRTPTLTLGPILVEPRDRSRLVDTRCPECRSRRETALWRHVGRLADRGQGGTEKSRRRNRGRRRCGVNNRAGNRAEARRRIRSCAASPRAP